jgi:hypothetical protein
LQTFQGWLLQQNQRVADIIPVGFGVKLKDFFDAVI